MGLAPSCSQSQQQALLYCVIYLEKQPSLLSFMKKAIESKRHSL